MLILSRYNVIIVKQNLWCCNIWLASVHGAVGTWYSGYYHMYNTKKIALVDNCEKD